MVLEELTVVLYVVDARENLFEVANSELLFFKVYYLLHVIICQLLDA
jgi:hypothetical protein